MDTHCKKCVLTKCVNDNRPIPVISASLIAVYCIVTQVDSTCIS